MKEANTLREVLPPCVLSPLRLFSFQPASLSLPLSAVFVVSLEVISHVLLCVQLQHPNIVRVFGYCTRPEIAVVMEYVSAGSLSVWIELNRAAPASALVRSLLLPPPLLLVLPFLLPPSICLAVLLPPLLVPMLEWLPVFLCTQLTRQRLQIARGVLAGMLVIHDAGVFLIPRAFAVAIQRTPLLQLYRVCPLRLEAREHLAYL